MLHVCHESRIEGLKKYKGCFVEEGGLSRAVHINISTDTLFIHVPISVACGFYLDRLLYGPPEDTVAIAAEFGHALQTCKLNPGMTEGNSIASAFEIEGHVFALKKIDEQNEVKDRIVHLHLRNAGIKRSQDEEWSEANMVNEFRPLVAWDAVWDWLMWPREKTIGSTPQGSG